MKMMAIPDRLIVRPTGVLIGDNKILIVKQDVTETRHWALPGGRLEFGETIEQCLIREIKEETGLDISVKELLYVTDRFYRNTHIVHMLFLVQKTGGKLRSGKELKLETEKIKEFTMAPVDKLHDYGFPLYLCHLVKSGFPERGSYKGNFEIFYGKL
jgi:mutator protein MutT